MTRALRARSELPWVAGTVLTLALITAIDSQRVFGIFPWSQGVSTALTGLWWALLYRHAGARLQRTMIIGLFLATAGELFFCKLVGMYEYRLGNIPWYVPPGHTILYATIHLFCRDRWVRSSRLPHLALAAGAAAYSLLWWQALGDDFGICCFAAFALLYIAVPRSRLFFASMYVLVALLELSGTRWGCWRWQPTLLGHWTRIPSANPPSGVAIFYSLFDLNCLAVYFFIRWPSFDRWIRLHPSRR